MAALHRGFLAIGWRRIAAIRELQVVLEGQQFRCCPLWVIGCRAIAYSRTIRAIGAIVTIRPDGDAVEGLRYIAVLDLRIGDRYVHRRDGVILQQSGQVVYGCSLATQQRLQFVL